MDRASSMQGDELSLELTLAAGAPAPGTPVGFFLCVYCDRKFRSSQGLGGHQNAHRQERAVARRRWEGAAAARKAGTPAADYDWKPEDPAGGNGGGSSSERSGVDLSLRL